MKTFVLHGFVLVFLLIGILPAEEPRTWSDKSGKFSVEAIALEFDGEVVVLKKDDERVLKLPLSKLSLSDQAYLKAKGKFKAEENPFGEAGEKEDAYDASRTVFPTTPQQLKTDKIVIAAAMDSEWSCKPAPGKEISLPKAVPLRFSLGEVPFEMNTEWSDLLFNRTLPSRILAGVDLSYRMKSGPSTAKVFSADVETGKIVSSDFPGGYRILDLSPDGTRLLIRQVEQNASNRHRAKSTLIHVVRLSRDLRPTHQACYEPFALEGWNLEARPKSFHEMTPEERDADFEKRKEEAKKRSAQFQAEVEARRKMTPEEREADFKKRSEPGIGRSSGSEKKKDRLGRTIQTDSFHDNPDNVCRGFWLDDNRVLLQSGGNCMISMNVDTGEILWSVPSIGNLGNPMEVVLSPERDYCLVFSPGRIPKQSRNNASEGVVSTRLGIQANPNQAAGATKIEMLSWSISSEYADTAKTPPILFDTKNARCRGRLETTKDCHAAKLFDFSPDGKTLAALGNDDSVLRWNLADGKLLAPIYCSPPYRQYDEVRTISGSIEKVQDNQEKPQVLRWVDGRYLKVGTVLIDTVAEMPVWRYLSFNSGFQANFGRYYWFVNSLGSDSMEIIPKKIPSSQVPEKERTSPDTTSWLIAPGTEIALRVDDSIGKDKEKITEALTRKITDNGWILKPDAPIVLLAQIGREQPRDLYIESDITQMSGGALTFTPGGKAMKIASVTFPRYEVVIKKGDKVFWEISVLPGLSNISWETIKNKTAQAQIDKNFQLMNYTDWFLGIRIPRKIRVETPLKETSVQMLGAE